MYWYVTLKKAQVWIIHSWRQKSVSACVWQDSLFIVFLFSYFPFTIFSIQICFSYEMAVNSHSQWYYQWFETSRFNLYTRCLCPFSEFSLYQMLLWTIQSRRISGEVPSHTIKSTEKQVGRCRIAQGCDIVQPVVFLSGLIHSCFCRTQIYINMGILILLWDLINRWCLLEKQCCELYLGAVCHIYCFPGIQTCSSVT